METNMFTAAILVMILYWVLTLGVGYWYGRGAGRSYETFHLADRDMALPTYTLTYMATFTGGGLVMGLATLAYTSGISAQWYAMTQGIAFITVVAFIAFLRRFRVVSVAELLNSAYGRGAGVLTALITLFGNVALTAGQTIGMASIVTVLTGIPLVYGFWISAAVFIAITAYGGLRGVAAADVLHGIILGGGIMVMVPYAIWSAGGISVVTDGVPEAHLNWVGVGLLQIISWYLMYVMTAGASQFFLQRVWAAKSLFTARCGTLLAGIFVFFFGLFTAAMGMLAKATGPADLDGRLAFAWAVENHLPSVAAALLLAAAVAAVMSGADSFLLAGSTTFVNDIYIPARERGGVTCSEGERVLVSRLVVVVLGLLAALIALSGVNIVPVNTMGMALMGAPVAVALAMLLWAKTRAVSAAPGIVVGAIVFAVWEFALGEPLSIESAVPTAVGTAVAMYLVSRFAPRSPEAAVAEGQLSREPHADPDPVG
jgi:SSS family solute:Na+ symporter